MKFLFKHMLDEKFQPKIFLFVQIVFEPFWKINFKNILNQFFNLDLYHIITDKAQFDFEKSFPMLRLFSSKAI
jgi:hypothetical protein